MTVRVRFAPSPTGALHPGSARTVLFNFLFAHREGGTFILRIEDTDRARLGEGSLESILEGLRWLGLGWDEGPDVGGPHAPYFQSERLEIYRDHVDRLLEAGSAYPCFCTRERLDALRQEQQKAGRPTRYDRLCAGLPADEVSARVEAGEPHVVRMRVPAGKTTVPDLVRGDLEFDNGSQDDQVILKSDGYPTYHLASTVDDHLMEITHVIRGDEWLASSPKQVMLYAMLGWSPPAFVHLPLVLGPDRAKLSKRHGAAAVLEYRDMGYLPQAMNNFLALLGWSPGTEQEFYDLEGLSRAFDLKRIQTSPAVFDQAKLDSVNGLHIRAMPVAELAAALRPFVPDLPDDLLLKATPLIRERIQRLTEAGPLLGFLAHRPTQLPDDIVPKLKEASREEAAGQAVTALQAVRRLFDSGPLGPSLEEPMRKAAAEIGWKAGDLFMTTRIALTGSRVTPPLLESAALLGQAECLVRLDYAIQEVGRRA
ncbi:MAG: glutamyl-tRNA synthetase [Chloroflexota bacterium]|nr:glutamyl-tRNA synthetase [Chloroflexota bacterium]